MVSGKGVTWYRQGTVVFNGIRHDIRDRGFISKDHCPPRPLARYLLEPRPSIAHRTNDMRSRITAANKLPMTGNQPMHKLLPNRTYQARPPPR